MSLPRCLIGLQYLALGRGHGFMLPRSLLLADLTFGKEQRRKISRGEAGEHPPRTRRDRARRQGNASLGSGILAK